MGNRSAIENAKGARWMGVRFALMACHPLITMKRMRNSGGGFAAIYRRRYPKVSKRSGFPLALF